MSLYSQTRQLDAELTATMDIEVLKRIQEADREIIGSGLYETAIGAGMAAPGFALENQVGEKVSLGALLAEGPVVLSFNRGSWCGFCRLELAALEAARETLESYGMKLVSISPQSPSQNHAMHADLALGFPVLSDPGARIAALYGLAYTLPEGLQEVYRQSGLDIAEANAADGADAKRIPVPATYLISDDGQVLFQFFDANYRNRLDPEELIAAQKAMAR